jgi:ankyrin repeat protein/cell wall assembly regulator SMI1
VAVWTDLERLLAEEPAKPTLAPPASDPDIARCEQRLRLRFPDELREAYLRHDGGDLPDDFRWFSLAEAERTWNELNEINAEVLDPEEAEAQYHELNDDGRIRVITYHAGRIPIASDDSTNLYVDCVPGPRGRVGQVIANYTECDYLVLGDTMTEFLEYLRDLVEARRKVHDDQFGFAVVERGGLRERLHAEAARLRAANTPGRLGLHQLVWAEDVDGVRDWVAAGRPLDEQDRDGDTALMAATGQYQWEMCRLLIDAGADVNLAGWQGAPLAAAAYRGDVVTCGALLRAGALPDTRDQRGRTALHGAASEGHVEIAQMLLAAGAGVDAADTEWGYTPLMEAAAYGHTGMVRLLLSHGADANARSGGRDTALMRAAERYEAEPEHLQTVQVLLAAGADPNLRDRDGRTARSRARDGRNETIVALLTRRTRR